VPDATVQVALGDFPFGYYQENFSTFGTDSYTAPDGSMSSATVTGLSDPYVTVSALNADPSAVLTYYFEAQWNGPGQAPAGNVVLDFTVSGATETAGYTGGGVGAVFYANGTGVAADPGVTPQIYDSVAANASFSYTDQILDVHPNVANEAQLNVQLYDIGPYAASAYVDPTITIDSSTPDASDYSIVYSSNLPQSSLPDGGATLTMLGGALAGLAALRRRFA
jgi:hypothetical protein